MKKRIINIILTTIAISFAAAAIAGAAMTCNYALILLVPALLSSVYPIYNVVKIIKLKLSINSR